MAHLKILILEDSRDDVDLIERELKKAGIGFTSLVVNKKVEFEAGLMEFKPDVILSDHSLPQFNSIEALKCYKAYQKQFNILIPFILITGAVSEEFAVQCIKAGVDDYILKDRLKRLPLSIQNALEKSRIENERLRYLGEVIANEALMKKAEHLANFGSWQVDLGTGKHTWSDEMYNIYGYGAGEVEPGFEIFFSHVHPDDIMVLKKGFEHALANLDSYEEDFRIMDHHGTVKYITSKHEINRNQEGHPIRLVGFNLDITSRKKAEITLKEAYAEKVNILESIGDAFFAVDKEWTVTYWNNIAEDQLGMPKENIIGKNLWSVYADAIPLAFYTQYHQAMRENIPIHFEEFYPPLNLWLEVSAYPSVTGLSVYFRDITDQKKYIKEIENQNERLKDIAWIQSHEVRAPLARIMGLVNLINNYQQKDMDLPHLLNTIVGSAEELDGLIRKIVRKTEEMEYKEIQ